MGVNTLDGPGDRGAGRRVDQALISSEGLLCFSNDGLNAHPTPNRATLANPPFCMNPVATPQTTESSIKGYARVLTPGCFKVAAFSATRFSRGKKAPSLP